MNSIKYLLSKVQVVDDSIVYGLIDLKSYDSFNIERFVTSFKSYIKDEKPLNNFILEPLENTESIKDVLSRRSNADYNTLSQLAFIKSLLPLTEKPIKNILMLKVLEITNENELFNISDYIEIINEK